MTDSKNMASLNSQFFEKYEIEIVLLVLLAAVTIIFIIALLNPFQGSQTFPPVGLSVRDDTIQFLAPVRALHFWSG